MHAALLCLAMNIYYEANGQPFKGQYAVAQVTINRADGDPRQVCKVVYAPSQFSWTAHRHGVPRSSAGWESAKHVAQLAMHGAFEDFTNGATYFHATNIRPRWAYQMQHTVTVGRHAFYKIRTQSRLTTITASRGKHDAVPDLI